MKRKHSNKNQILLSVTALLLILLVAAGVTYSWIEGGVTYTIKTENNGDVKTGKVPDTTVFEGLVINPKSSATIDLNQFDKTSNDAQDLYFSPVSSNGENFYFPTAYDDDGNPTSYRKSNTNDVGTKFINYNFDIKASKKCYLAFDGKPTFTITKNGQSLTDTSAFRIMIKSGDESKVITTSDTDLTSTIVTDESGTTANMQVESVSKYLANVNHTNKLFNYEKDETENVEVSIWLDGEAADSDLLGSDVKVDLNLRAIQETFKVSFDVVTYNNSGELVSDTTFTGGKIKVDSTTYTSPFNKVYNDGDEVSATAVANTGYTFNGWYSDESCTTSVTAEEVMTATVSDNATYFAKFTEKPKNEVSAEVITTPEDETGGTVTVNGSGTSVTDYVDTTVTLKATANSGYRFVGWYKDADCTVILNNTYTTATQSVSIGTADATYYAKFIKQYEIEFVALTNGEANGDGGTVSIGTDSGSSVLKTVDVGTIVTLTATASSNATFEGIYDADGNLVTALTTKDVTVTKSVKYYAHFEKTTTITTIYFASRSGYSQYNAYVYNKADESIHYFSDSYDWPGDEAKYDSTTGYYKYTFETSDVGSFRVIVSDNGSNQYPTSNTPGLEGVIGGTYFFDSGSPTKLTEYDPSGGDDQESTTTIYFAKREGFTEYSVWAYGASNSANYSGGNSWPGATAILDSVTGYYMYSFKTTDTGNFRVILSNNGASQYPTNDGLLGAIGGTYFFDSGSPTSLTEFDPTAQVTITFDASSTTWVAEASATMYLYDNSTGNQYYMARTSSTGYLWTATVPATVTNITFNRKNTSGGTWNHWDAGSRGSKTTYKTTGDGAGSWQ